MKTYETRRFSHRATYQLHDDRIVILGAQRFGRQWESAFRLRDLSPLPSRIWLRNPAFSTIAGSGAIILCSVFVTLSHALWHISDAPLVVGALLILILGAIAVAFNPFRTEWVTFNYQDGRPAFSLVQSPRALEDFHLFTREVQAAIEAVDSVLGTTERQSS